MMNKRLCISADSHVVEPPEVYDGLEKRFGDKAPRMVDDPERGLVTAHGDGTFGYTVGAFHTAGQDWGDPEVRERAKSGFKYARPGVLNPVERIKDQEADGIDAELLYPSVLFSVYQLQDVEIMQATMANYNDWLHNYASQAPGRLFCLSLVQLNDLDLAIEELQRTAKMGFVGACIPCSPPEGKPYSDSYYDKFWAAAQELKQPLAMHIFTGATRHDGLPDWGVLNYSLASTAIARVILDLTWGGVCERFPGVRFVPTEFDTGWVAHLLYRTDYSFMKEGGFCDRPYLKMLPSGYWHRNFRITFEDDALGIRTRDLIGVENLVWGSDYPHADSLFPESQTTLDRIFQGVSAEDRFKITAANAVKLYNLPFEA